MDDDRTRADDRPISDSDGAEDYAIRTDVDTIANPGNASPGFTLADGCALAEGAIPANYRILVHHKSNAVVDHRSSSDPRSNGDINRVTNPRHSQVDTCDGVGKDALCHAG